MQTLTVHAPSHAYPIFIDEHLFQSAKSILQPCITQQVAIITNNTIANLYLDTWTHILDAMHLTYFSIILPDGEAYKNWETLNLIYDGLMQHRAERNTTLLALGGGVIGDMVGFAAATYQRGTPFIQIPTTLLSQVDSSVGGKTAINHPLGKNMIGAFYQPQTVLIDVGCLKTLPPREFSAGMAEVIKYALLGDETFLSWLETHIHELMNQQADILTEAIHRCCQMKADIVSQDEQEHGIRAHLNLGHTFAHAIETEIGYGQWLHGEAVAAGLVLASHLSMQLGYIQQTDIQRIIRLLQQAKLPVQPPKMSFSSWITHMQHDKKVQQGCMRFVILKKIGQAQLINNIDEHTLSPLLQPFISDNQTAL